MPFASSLPQTSPKRDCAAVWCRRGRPRNRRSRRHSGGEAVVRSALNKGYGLRRIRQILREKEIPQEYWEELLSDLPPMDDAVDKLLRQKLKSAQPDQKEVQRAVDALLRHGHSWQDIRAGLDRFRLNLDLEDLECQ